MTKQKALLAKLRSAQSVLKRLERGESPTDKDLAGAPLLNYWSVVPEGRFLVLQGQVTGHPSLADNDFVQTSVLLWLSPDSTTARTLSRFYRLGLPWDDLLKTPH